MYSRLISLRNFGCKVSVLFPVNPMFLVHRPNIFFSFKDKYVSQNCLGTKRSFTQRAPVNVVINNQKLVEIDCHNVGLILEHYDTLLFDCDGVLWKTDHETPLPGIPSAMQTLQRLHKQLFFVTNNSMHARNAYVTKFHEHGFDVPSEDVFCIAYASAVYLRNVLQIERNVYVIGNEGMAKELDAAGIAHFGVGPDPDPACGDVPDLLKIPLHDDVHAVLVGYDKHFNFNKLFKASSYLTKENCLFLATSNIEKSVLISHDRRQPIVGVFVDAVSSAACRQPLVLGKPSQHLFDCIKAMHPRINLKRTLMIGDSVPADVGLAKAIGVDSVLVLTGSSNLDTISKFPGLEPEYFMQSVATFVH